MKNFTQLFLDQIVQLENQLFPNDAWTAVGIANLLKAEINEVIFLQESEQLVGYCLYQSVFETAEILRIGVNPDCQHQGSGTQIFNELIEILRQKNVENLMLEVRADNQNAINFYQKHGFNLIYRRKNYYNLKNGNSVDALIMQKLLAKH